MGGRIVEGSPGVGCPGPCTVDGHLANPVTYHQGCGASELAREAIGSGPKKSL